MSPDNTRKTTLPNYDNPPVHEVVCGLRFDPLKNFKIPYVGLFWSYFREQYPKVEHAQPLGSDSGFWMDDATGLPIPRIWLINKEDDQLIQFQVDRFMFNWRKRKGAYPQYDHIISNFENQFRTLAALIAEQGIGNIQPLEFELTYVNQIPAGNLWTSPKDLSEVFCDLRWNVKEHSFLPVPSGIAWNVRFDLPENKGHLTAKLTQGIRTSDSSPILTLEMTAKGSGTDKSMKGMREWFDLAHEWIVAGFADLTSESAQLRAWGKKNV